MQLTQNVSLFIIHYVLRHYMVLLAFNIQGDYYLYSNNFTCGLSIFNLFFLKFYNIGLIYKSNTY